MRSRSPTLLSVTLRQLQRGASMSLADCFRMELGMAAHSFEQGDFLEGVRAVLIDKDNRPRWRPSRIEEVSEAAIEAFFKERWRAAEHPLAALESHGAELVLRAPAWPRLERAQYLETPRISWQPTTPQFRSSVRRHPMHNPCALSRQMLMQGEGTAAAFSAASTIDSPLGGWHPNHRSMPLVPAAE